MRLERDRVYLRENKTKVTRTSGATKIPQGNLEGN